MEGIIRKFGNMLGFPEEAVEYLEACFEKLECKKDCVNLLYDAMDNYFCETDYRYLETLQQISETSGLHRYALDMIFLILCAVPLKYIYKQKNLSDKLYLDTMNELKYKLLECKAIYGCWGTFVTGWFHRFFLCQRFQLGRLQYDKIPFPYEDYKGKIRKGDMVYNCHIPASGPLIKEEVLDSFKKAYHFYKPFMEGEIMPIVCRSWLLYPSHYKVFPENSNIRGFYELFDVIDATESKNNHDFWRIFNQEYSDNTDNWPERTKLQKNFKKYLMDGGIMGEGFGVILFDGCSIYK